MKSHFFKFLAILTFLGIHYPNIIEAQQIRTLLNIGHQRHINTVRFSSDGKQIITCSNDGTIRFWDRKSGYLVKILSGEAEFEDFAVAPNGRHLLTVSEKKGVTKLKIWDITKESPIRTLESHESSYFPDVFSLSSRGDFIATGYRDKIKIWNAKTFKVIRKLMFSGHNIQSMAFSDDGKHLAVADKIIHVWNTDNWSQKVLKGHKEKISFLDFDRKGEKLISKEYDIVKLWNVNTGRLIKTLEYESSIQGPVWFNSNGKGIYLALNGVIQMQDLYSEAHMKYFVVHREENTHRVYSVLNPLGATYQPKFVNFEETVFYVN